jgi:hypothetical protein
MRLSPILAVGLYSGTALFAAPIAPTGYDTDNGGTGFFTYFDDDYNGAGSKTTPYARLTNGTTGQLLDTVFAGGNWFADPFDWVGWLVIPHNLSGQQCIDDLGSDPNCHPGLGRSPSMDFKFGSVTAFGTVSLHVDDANGFGGVRVPLGVELLAFTGSTITSLRTYLLNDPNPDMTPRWYHLDASGLSADQLTIRLLYRDHWVFMDEVAFDSTVLSGAIVHQPEPASLVLTAAGLAGLLWWRRKRAC